MFGSSGGINNQKGPWLINNLLLVRLENVRHRYDKG